VTTEAAAWAWVDGWARAWPAADAAAVAALYTDDAVFRSAPFRDTQAPGDYAAWAFAGQESAQCRFGEPFVVGNRALVEYWAHVTVAGRTETIAGISVLRFAADGRVAEQRDYWHEADGRREAPPEWGA
jgi:ketosteroid isomerase-like protein